MNPSRVDSIVDLTYGLLIAVSVGMIPVVGTETGVAFGFGVLVSFVLHIVWKMARFDPQWMTSTVEETVDRSVDERVGAAGEATVDEAVARQLDTPSSPAGGANASDGRLRGVRARARVALDVHADATITVLYVAGEPSPMMGKALRLALEPDVQQAAEELAQGVFEEARAHAADHGVEIDTEVTLGNPTRQIVDRADAFDAVVIGSHGGSLQSTLFIGNVARAVSSRAPVPVTIVR